MRRIVELLTNDSLLNTSVTVKGWTRSVRDNKKFAFVIVNDGSCQKNIQVVVDSSINNYNEIVSLLSGSSIEVTGKLVESAGKGQSVEVHCDSLTIISKVDSSYPLQKKATSLEFLREVAHLRPRTNLFGAIFRLRHHLSMATHEFFSNEGFYYLNSPILTAVDAEGAGEMFTVTNMNLDKILQGSGEKVNFKRDYFQKKTSLCVTGQLEAECFASGMGAVYTFGPTFRAENSNTPRHLSEFWMVEPEKAFMDLEGNAQLAESYIKHLIRTAFNKAPDELDAIVNYLKFSAKGTNSTFTNHLPILEKVMNSNFEIMTYTKAIDVLIKSGKKFEFPVEYGVELQTEHERYLSEVFVKGPVTVTDYPKEFKAFYMKQNDDGKTVRAMDVLVPGVGEIIGGSQREEDLGKLERRMEELNMDKDPLWWYLDLRRYGSVPHSGFGLGFERAIRYISGMKNIRDVIPFPRSPKSCDF